MGVRWSRPPGARGGCGAALQPRGLRAPGPCGYFLCEQKVTKKSLEPEVPDLPLGAALWARRLGGGLTGIGWSL